MDAPDVTIDARARGGGTMAWSFSPQTAGFPRDKVPRFGINMFPPEVVAEILCFSVAILSSEDTCYWGDDYWLNLTLVCQRWYHIAHQCREFVSYIPLPRPGHNAHQTLDMVLYTSPYSINIRAPCYVVGDPSNPPSVKDLARSPLAVVLNELPRVREIVMGGERDPDTDNHLHPTNIELVLSRIRKKPAPLLEKLYIRSSESSNYPNTEFPLDLQWTPSPENLRLRTVDLQGCGVYLLLEIFQSHALTRLRLADVNIWDDWDEVRFILSGLEHLQILELPTSIFPHDHSDSESSTSDDPQPGGREGRTAVLPALKEFRIHEEPSLLSQMLRKIYFPTNPALHFALILAPDNLEQLAARDLAASLKIYYHLLGREAAPFSRLLIEDGGEGLTGGSFTLTSDTSRTRISQKLCVIVGEGVCEAPVRPADRIEFALDVLTGDPCLCGSLTSITNTHLQLRSSRLWRQLGPHARNVEMLEVGGCAALGWLQAMEDTEYALFPMLRRMFVMDVDFVEKPMAAHWLVNVLYHRLRIRDRACTRRARKMLTFSRIFFSRCSMPETMMDAVMTAVGEERVGWDDVRFFGPRHNVDGTSHRLADHWFSTTYLNSTRIPKS